VIASIAGVAFQTALLGALLVLRPWAVPSLRLEETREELAWTQVWHFTRAAQSFRSRTGVYPSQSEGLESLVQPPKASARFFERAPLDPWGRPYLYFSPGLRNQQGFDVCSLGPDGEAGSADDICNYEPWYGDDREPTE